MPTAPIRTPRFLARLPGEARPVAARFDRRDGAPRALASPPPEPAAPAAPTPAALAELRREDLERVAATVETLRAQASRLAEQARTDALEIGFLVARTILETEVRTSPEVLFALVKTALRRASGSRRITLRVCPGDAARLAEDPGGPLESMATARVEVVPDPTLQPGDCMVDADFGQIDGRLETRLGELRRAAEAAAEGAA